MKTKSERFVDSRRESWASLREILKKISKKGVRKLSTDEISCFPDLYRSCCQDLAEARMLNLSPDVIEYLNGITGQAHSYLYFVKPLSRLDISRFFRRFLPHGLIDNAPFVLIALLLFWGSAAASFISVLYQPDMVYRFLSQNVVEQLETMYRESAATGRTAAEQTHMSAYYIQHNTSIAFLCFSTGIFLGLGSVYFLIYNGVFLGTIFAHLVNQGMGNHLLEFVTAHAFLELNAIAISGAAGLMLGMSLLKSWKLYSWDGVKAKRDEILLLVGTAAILLFCAAMIEGYISPAEIPYSWKVAVAIVSIVLVLLYFVILPLRQKRSE